METFIEIDKTNKLTLNKRKVSCLYETEGCSVKMSIEDLLIHEIDCDFKLLECAHCKVNFMRSESFKHKDICKADLKDNFYKQIDSGSFDAALLYSEINKLKQDIEALNLNNKIKDLHFANLEKAVKDQKEEIDKLQKIIEVIEQQILCNIDTSNNKNLKKYTESNINEDKALVAVNSINYKEIKNIIIKEIEECFLSNYNIKYKELFDQINNLEAKCNIEYDLLSDKQEEIYKKTIDRMHLELSTYCNIPNSSILLKSDSNDFNNRSKSIEALNFLYPLKQYDFKSKIWSFLYLMFYKDNNNNKSEDQENILVGTENGNILLYSIKTNQIVNSFSKHESFVYSIIDLKCYKENYFATGSYDTLIKIFTLDSIDPVQIIQCESSVICMSNLIGTKFSSYFITGLGTGTLELFTNSEGNFKRKNIKNLIENAAQSLIFFILNQEEYLIIFYSNGEILLLDANSFSIKLEFNKEHRKGLMYSIKYYKEDLFLSKSNSDKVVKIWSINTKFSLYTFSNFEFDIRTIGIIPEEEMLFCSLTDKTIHLFDLRTKQLIKNCKVTHECFIFNYNLDYTNKILFTDHRSKLLIFNFN